MLVIYKKSAYQIYIRERKNRRIQELLEAGDPTVYRLLESHDAHTEAVARARRVLSALGIQAVFRHRSDVADPETFDLIVSLGGDGTLLWASHVAGPECPVLAINTSPDDSVGFFCAGHTGDLEGLIQAALRGELRETRVCRMRVELDDEVVSRRVLNDVLFSHQCPAATSRYFIRLGESEEEHKSSGVWVGPAAGSTGALHSAGGRILPISSRRLQFVVREPYERRELSLLRGFIQPGQQLQLRSRIRAGSLYVDGPHLARRVDMGSELRMCLSDEPLKLLGFRGRPP